jgi:hypothetical protein
MKTRDVALRINDPAAHEEMLKMAASYERLAEHAIALAKLDLPSSPSDAIRDDHRTDPSAPALAPH